MSLGRHKNTLRAFLSVFCGIVLFVTISIIGIKLYCTRYVWEHKGIPFFAKVRITWSNNFIPIKRAYIVTPDRSNNFIVIVNDALWTGERHMICTYDGCWVATQSFSDRTGRKITITPTISIPTFEAWVVAEQSGEQPILLWRKLSQQQFKSDSFTIFLTLKPEEIDREALDVAGGLFSSGYWQWFVMFGDLMMKYNSVRYCPTVMRYASGNFTDRERTINSKSNISAEEIRNEAIRLKRLYCIGK